MSKDFLGLDKLNNLAKNMEEQKKKEEELVKEARPTQQQYREAYLESVKEAYTNNAQILTDLGIPDENEFARYVTLYTIIHGVNTRTEQKMQQIFQENLEKQAKERSSLVKVAK